MAFTLYLHANWTEFIELADIILYSDYHGIYQANVFNEVNRQEGHACMVLPQDL